MYFTGVKSSSINQKDIGAFYGVNRTNKINDYQMSDVKNVDCESFPYLATRRARKLFYDENKMAVICHDTDITNDYKVTGVTESGDFVYRGKYISCLGELAGNTAMCEYLGDYVLFPVGKYVSIKNKADGDETVYEATVSDFSVSEAVTGCEEGLIENHSSSSFTHVLGQYVNMYPNKIEYLYSSGQNSSMRYYFEKVFSDYYPGMAFKPELLLCNGRTYKAADNKTYVDIPDDVYCVITDMYMTRQGDENKYRYGDEGFTLLNYQTCVDYDYVNTLVIEYEARNSLTGELYDISRHFESYTNGTTAISSVECFQVGVANVSLGSSSYYYWNAFFIKPCVPPLLFGVSYAGRLFGCDLFGVDVFYTSGSGVVNEKYNFTPGTSLGGAGSVQCADHGRWTALISYGGALYAFKKNGMYRIYSSDGLNFYMDKVCDVGAVSQKAVCVVSDVMYFLSETGLYRFTGTYPEELPDNLDRHYIDGVLGGYDNKVYCSLVYSGGTELIVYDAQVNAYGVHDAFKASGFVTYGGKLYGLDSADGYVYEMSGERKPLEFSINTRRFFVGFEKKAVNGIRLYFDFSGGENEKIEVFVSYDGGAWEPCFKPITSGRLKYVPIKFKKCDELCVKIQGNGVFTLKGMTISFYSGGDIKQNK